MKVVIDIKQNFDLSAAIAAASEYECSYGSSFIVTEFEACYTTCRGNSASVTSDGRLTLEGTRHGLFSAIGSLETYTGISGITDKFKNGKVVLYETTQPTWRWWETLDGAFLRGDKAAIKEVARRKKLKDWEDKNPILSEDFGGVKCVAEEWLMARESIPKPILDRRLDLLPKGARVIVEKVLKWEAAKP